jgi:adenosylcobyric acid synthase
MVLGTTSGAGKSWLTTALCRYYSNQGMKVAPFKAQNMSNNARVVAAPTLATACAALPPEGAHPALGRPGGGVAGLESAWGEIGSAQYFQALAARAVPGVRMNPLLLKPEADTHSQVVLLGQVSEPLTALPWRGRSAVVWPQIAAALDELRAENDVVVIEGAGSPAETNLHASDIVNMRVARHAHARCLLVTDIDRGGAFAHLYGTWALLPEDERALIHGFVLNKFRGDASLLAPAPQHLQERTGVPTVATIPMQWHHGLPEEDVFLTTAAPPPAPCTPPWPWWPTRASATWMNSSRSRTCPACACNGCAARPTWRACGLATGSCCRGRRPPPPTWPGCACRGLTVRLLPTQGRAAPCWVCAAACRCWARR